MTGLRFKEYDAPICLSFSWNPRVSVSVALARNAINQNDVHDPSQLADSQGKVPKPSAMSGLVIPNC